MRPTTRLLVLAIPTLSLFSACASGPVPQPLPPQARDMLMTAQQSPSSTGDQVYEGQVYSLASRREPLFRYERRVHSVDEGVASTGLNPRHLRSLWCGGRDSKRTPYAEL